MEVKLKSCWFKIEKNVTVLCWSSRSGKLILKFDYRSYNYTKCIQTSG
jgi:hypothetical protein